MRLEKEMSLRNLSPQRMFTNWANAHNPIYRFSDCGISDFQLWKDQALPEVKKCLGRFPDKVPADPELLAEWMHDGLRKQRWVIDVGPGISANLLINYPCNISPGDKLPAILCCHGHGVYGKEPVMGNDSSDDLAAHIRKHNYNYGHVMAQNGFVTFAIDWIGFGERNDSRKPNHIGNPGTKDWCNLYYLHATMLGTTSLAINIAHGSAAVDFICSLDEVDSGRLGVMGLSGGGTMSVWMKLCDSRLKAAEVMGYSDLWANFGIRDLNYCGMQIAPGLFYLVDVPDLQGLIAPDPLLIDIGVYDECFKIDAAMACYKQLENIYDAAGIPDKLSLDLFPGGHAWGGNKSVDFFKKYLS